MMNSRRGFLQGMLGLGVGLAVAPAICKSENMMKIIVPKKEILTLNGRGLSSSIFVVDELPFLNADYDGDTVMFERLRNDTTSIFNRVKNGDFILDQKSNMLYVQNKGIIVPSKQEFPNFNIRSNL